MNWFTKQILNFTLVLITDLKLGVGSLSWLHHCVWPFGFSRASIWFSCVKTQCHQRARKLWAATRMLIIIEVSTSTMVVIPYK